MVKAAFGIPKDLRCFPRVRRSEYLLHFHCLHPMSNCLDENPARPEGQETLIDWGAKPIKRDKNVQSLAKVEGLIG
jgi:hypothetical protein